MRYEQHEIQRTFDFLFSVIFITITQYLGTFKNKFCVDHLDYDFIVLFLELLSFADYLKPNDIVLHNTRAKLQCGPRRGCTVPYVLSHTVSNSVARNAHVRCIPLRITVVGVTVFSVTRNSNVVTANTQMSTPEPAKDSITPEW